MSHYTILGAGVMGLVMATELTARGHCVTVHEPSGQPGPQSCSWWAGGMLAPDCESQSAPPEVSTQGRKAIQWWDKHTNAVTHQGSLVLAMPRDHNDLLHFEHLSQSSQRVNAEAIGQLEPDLAGRFQHGLFYPDEAHLAPRKTLAALQQQLEQTDTVFVQTDQVPTSGHVIDCRGLAARDHLADLRGVRGEMALLECPELNLSRPIRLLHPRTTVYVVPRGNGLYMIGATMIESDERGAVTARSLHDLLSAAWMVHPAFGEAKVRETGADARPAFADNLPHIRQRNGRLYINGLFRHGYLLSPMAAQMAADYLETGKPPLWMDQEPA